MMWGKIHPLHETRKEKHPEHQCYWINVSFFTWTLFFSHIIDFGSCLKKKEKKKKVYLDKIKKKYVNKITGTVWDDCKLSIYFWAKMISGGGAGG